MRVSIQGLPGSYHDLAARHLFGNKYQPLCRNTLHQVLWDVGKGHVDYGVLSSENALYGSINQVYDALHADDRLWVAREVYIRVKQCLIGLKGARIDDLREVHAHPVSLAQCEDYLDEELPYVERIASRGTAASVVDVKRWGDKTRAAIANPFAAKLYGLSILKESIESQPDDFSRFIAISTSKVVPAEATKTSVELENLSDETGIIPSHRLYSALGWLADRQIDLLKIRTRLLFHRGQHRILYIDCDANLNENRASEALSGLESQGLNVRVLGSYPSGDLIG